MKKKINTVIAGSGFKDSFSFDDFSNVISSQLLKDRDYKHNIFLSPLADGGEKSINALEKILNNTRREKALIYNAAREKTNIDYLVINSDSVFIDSSLILKIDFDDFDNQNPLYLSSEGLGEMVQFVYKKGFRNIIIGLGGTSTVDAGLGFLDALGVIFYDSKGIQISPLYGEDISKVVNFDAYGSLLLNDDLNITFLCDAKANFSQIETPTLLKIGSKYDQEKYNIFNQLKNGLDHTLKLSNNFFSSHRDFNNFSNFFGVAGGMLILSSFLIKNLKVQLGAEYFIHISNFENLVKKADLVITGEGMLDNSTLGKIPIKISLIAKKYNKKLIYIIGSTDEKLNSPIEYMPPRELQELGISAILTTLGKKQKEIPIRYDLLDFYKSNTTNKIGQHLNSMIAELFQ